MTQHRPTADEWERSLNNISQSKPTPRRPAPKPPAPRRPTPRRPDPPRPAATQPFQAGRYLKTAALLLIIVTIFSVYFANVVKADFPGANAIRDLTGSAARLRIPNSDGPQSIAEIAKGPTQQTELQNETVPTLQIQHQNIPLPTSQISFDGKLESLKNGPWMKYHHPQTFNIIEDLPWVKDELTEAEADTVQDLLNMAANDHQTLEIVLGLQWTGDHIAPPESKAIKHLMYLSYRDQEASRKVAEMPFMESITEADALLIDGLHSLWHRGILSEFMNHPTVADGINDDEIIYAIATTTIEDSSQFGKVLNPDNAKTQTLQTASSRTPNLNISIVRPGATKVTDSIKVIEDAVRYVEDAMDLQMPTNHVILLMDDTGVIPGYAGTNYGQAIGYTRKGENGSDWDNAAFKAGMVHEVAHYFWTGNESWVDEGIADTIEHNYVRDFGLPSEMLISQRGECSLNTLQELSTINPELGDPHHKCSYYLGQRLFLELQNLQGEQEFRSGLIDLYHMSQSIRENDGQAGLTEVQEAFPQQRDVIAKHWTGKAPATLTAQAATPTSAITSQPTNVLNLKDMAATLMIPTKPILRPTATSVPTPRVFIQEPIPTLRPTPALPTTHQEHSPLYGYRITVPRNWKTAQQGTETIFRSPDQTGQIKILVKEFPEKMDERQFAKQIRQEAINTYAHKDDHFDIYAWEEQFTKNAQWQQKFTWALWSPEDSCVKTRTDVIFRSQHFPSRTKAFILTLSACSERFTQHIADWENSLESFTEVIPKT